MEASQTFWLITPVWRSFVKDNTSKNRRKSDTDLESRQSSKTWLVNDAIADHQIKNRDWIYFPVIREVHRAVSLYQQFLFKQEKLPPLVFGIGRIGRCTLGHFMKTHNDYGLQYEVMLSESHVLQNSNEEGWYRILGTVLHECLHAWQLENGEPGVPPYHNKEFRDKAEEFGLVIDSRGYTEYLESSPFKDLIAKFEFKTPDIEWEKSEPRKRQSSRNYLWTCNCSKIRGATTLQVFCEKCNTRFERNH